jgi:alanyl-tRNA synthetase
LHQSGKEVPGAKAFELYDTFGLIDLTALILRKGFSLDEAGFDKAMLEQKNTFSASEVSTDDWKILVEREIRDLRRLDQTESEAK